MDIREVDSNLPEKGEDEKVENGDENDERNWVEIAEEIVGQSVGVHDTCLRSKVVVDLVVAVKGIQVRQR